MKAENIIAALEHDARLAKALSSFTDDERSALKESIAAACQGPAKCQLFKFSFAKESDGLVVASAVAKTRIEAEALIANALGMASFQWGGPGQIITCEHYGFTA